MISAAPAASAPVVVDTDTLVASRHRYTIISAVVTTLAFIVIAVFELRWPGATLLAIASPMILSVHWLKTRDALWPRLGLIGLCGAPLTLVGDWICVHHGGLTYTAGGPFLLESPLYLPMLYIPAAFQIWLTMDMIREKFGLAADAGIEGGPLYVGMAASALFGALYVPLYEYLAKWGDLWVYVDMPGPGAGVVPWYVFGAEIVQFSMMPFLMVGLHKRSLGQTAFLGFFMGVTVVGCWTLALLLFAPPIG